MIIDDEVLVRVGLKSLIDWEENGYQIVGEADNGDEGIKLIKKTKPDIVITDIKMPIKDGLEMINELKTGQLDTEFIVLSSYDEFHLVKEAMKIGAVDYLIKLELDNKLLLETLTPIKNRINEKRKEIRNEKILKYNINSEENMRKEFFKKIIGELIVDKDEINLIVKELNISINEDSLACIVLRVNNINSLNKFSKGDMQLFEFSIINIIEEIVNDYFDSYAFMNNWGEIVLIFSTDNDLLEGDYFKKLDEMVEILSKMLEQYFSVKIDIVISDRQKGIANLGSAYFECSQALEYSYYCPEGKAIYYREINDYKKSIVTSVDFSIVIDKFTELLENMDSKGLENLFNDLISQFERKKISREQAYDLCLQMVYQIKMIFKEDIVSETFDRNEDFYKSIDYINNITGMLNWLKKVEVNLLKLIEKYTENEKNYIITQARKYIKGNFREELNLSDLAQELNVSTGYLSTLFKEVMGIGFSEYIKELKIEEAKELLRKSNVKIYKISEMVGYNNPYYFSRVFKRSTGRTPSEYRLKKY